MFLILSCSTPSLSEKSKGLLLEKGRAFTSYFFNEKFENIWQAMSPKMIEAFKSKEQLAETLSKIKKQIGTEVERTEELVYPSNITHSTYYRKSNYSNTDDNVLVLNWSFDTSGKISGFFIRGDRKPAKSVYLEYQNKNEYFFPFISDAHITWGGRRIEENYHVDVANQRFAYDIGLVKDGKLYKGKGITNTDFYCFGADVYSTSKGIVVDRKDGVRENILGQMNRKELMGNYVVIDHGNDEYSFFAHLKNGSVQVNKGQMVTKDSIIGKCGNTGNSSEPHLHYHLQDKPEFAEGKGLPVFFKDIVVDGKRHKKYEPIINQTVHRLSKSK